MFGTFDGTLGDGVFTQARSRSNPSKAWTMATWFSSRSTGRGGYCNRQPNFTVLGGEIGNP